MSSRFIAAGSAPDPTSTLSDDGWSKARQDVESRKNIKPVEPGQQGDGKSLYEVLQANKTAKQEAFEEASKVRNQFRPLDNSEVEFLDSVRELERTKENFVRQETSEQLQIFRKNQLKIEAAARNVENESRESLQETSNVWKASKKRRREKPDKDDPVPRTKKHLMTESTHTGSKSPTDEGIDLTDQSKEKDSQKIVALPEAIVASATIVKPEGLGLSAYESDDD